MSNSVVFVEVQSGVIWSSWFELLEALELFSGE